VIRRDRHRRPRPPEERPRPITAGIPRWVIVVLCLLITVRFSPTSLPVVERPAVGSAGNASGQVALPRLSVEIHEGDVTVYEGDTLIETLPWVDDPDRDDLAPVLQRVQATQLEGRVAGGSARQRPWRSVRPRITAGEMPHIGRA